MARQFRQKMVEDLRLSGPEHLDDFAVFTSGQWVRIYGVMLENPVGIKR